MNLGSPFAYRSVGNGRYTVSRITIVHIGVVEAPKSVREAGFVAI
jgi:hypothetical protein